VEVTQGGGRRLCDKATHSCQLPTTLRPVGIISSMSSSHLQQSNNDTGLHESKSTEPLAAINEDDVTDDNEPSSPRSVTRSGVPISVTIDGNNNSNSNGGNLNDNKDGTSTTPSHSSEVGGKRVTGHWHHAPMAYKRGPVGSGDNDVPFNLKAHHLVTLGEGMPDVQRMACAIHFLVHEQGLVTALWLNNYEVLYHLLPSCFYR
jgi:hypothetical protein